MAEDSIDKENKLVAAEDYNFLRREGISVIENLAGKIWTDYNSHDPGITLLEALCYAITDLAYRTSFDIRDILANESEGNDNNYDYRKDLYTAREILACNPITLNDYRKLIIDISGVKNAWVEMADDCEVPVFITDDDPSSPKKPILTYEERSEKKYNDMLPLKGLYNIFVELDDFIINEKRNEEIIIKVRSKMNAHRNLCEDFFSIAPLEYQLFTIEIELRVREAADINLIAATIFNIIQNYFSPYIRFYSLEELVEKGYSAEEIFDGPVLDHGFIINEELEFSERYKDIYLSDIIKLLSDIEGVMSINELSIPQQAQSEFSAFNDWVSNMKAQRKAPKLDDNFNLSRIKFIKSSDRHRSELEQQPDMRKVKPIFSFLQSAYKNNKLKRSVNNFNAPAGQNMEIADYYPFQKDLPPCYATHEKYTTGAALGRRKKKSKKLSEDYTALIYELIDEEKKDADKKKKTDPSETAVELISGLNKNERLNLQLRAYLLIFEQIMSNYLSQLAHVKELFSFNDQIKQTLFHQTLQEVNDLEVLFVDYTSYLKNQNNTTENETEFLARRNMFLDHLLARFGEKMPDYRFSLSYKGGVLNNAESVEARMKRDKLAFLQEYIHLSNYRAKSYDYTDDKSLWDTNNVEGFKKRISMLLGIQNYKRRQLATEEIKVVEVKEELDVRRYRVEVYNVYDKNHVLLQSSAVETKEEANLMLNYIISHGHKKERYVLHDKKGNASYQLKMPNQEGGEDLIAESIITENIEEVFKQTIQVFKTFAHEEGFHIIEHILLRPKITARTGLEKKSSKANASQVMLLPVNDTKQTINLKRNNEATLPLPQYEFKIFKIKGTTTWKLHLLKEDERNGKNDQSSTSSDKETITKEILVVNDDFDLYYHLATRAEHIKDNATDIANYEIKNDVDGRFYFQLVSNGLVLAASKEKYAEQKSAEDEIKALIHFFSYEEILPIPSGKEAEAISAMDPYSFNISIIIPDWPQRFRDPGFKHLMEKTIYLETPAHINPNIIWVNHREMRHFEKAYKIWLEEQAKREIPDTEELNKLIIELNMLKTERLNSPQNDQKQQSL